MTAPVRAVRPPVLIEGGATVAGELDDPAIAARLGHLHPANPTPLPPDPETPRAEMLTLIPGSSCAATHVAHCFAGTLCVGLELAFPLRDPVVAAAVGVT